MANACTSIYPPVKNIVISMKYADFSVGYRGMFTKVVTSEDNDIFAKLSGDFNPIHFDDAVGRRCGYKARVSNGFVTESRVAAALVETFGSDKTIVVALEKNTRFCKPVFMGDEITATVEVIGRLEAIQALKIHALCFNQNNEKVIETFMIVKILSI